MATKKFGIIGGDIRQIYMAKSLIKDGHKILIYGFEKADLSNHNLANDSISNLISKSEYIVLPVPITRDGVTINAPFAKENIKIDSTLAKKLKNKKVFGGIISQLKKTIKTENFTCLKDYFDSEDFQLQNAVPTAEGAVKIGIEKSQKTIHKSSCMVVGYGRIGKVLSKLLKNMGANVTVSSRCPLNKQQIETSGCTYIDINSFDVKLDYDLIFNTVPSLIFDEKMLMRCAKSIIIIDLASAPGGVDFKLAKKMKITAIHALGIPGKFFPKTAGKIIKNTIYAIIEEENL